MIKCASCGAENSSYSIYCKGCGAVLSSIDSVPDAKEEEKISVPNEPVKASVPAAEPVPAKGDDPQDDGFRYIATDKNDKGSYTYDPSRDRTLRPDYVPEDHSGDTVKAILIVGIGVLFAVGAFVLYVVLVA